jgi:hypothetical protein
MDARAKLASLTSMQSEWKLCKGFPCGETTDSDLKKTISKARGILFKWYLPSMTELLQASDVEMYG